MHRTHTEHIRDLDRRNEKLTEQVKALCEAIDRIVEMKRNRLIWTSDARAENAIDAAHELARKARER